MKICYVTESGNHDSDSCLVMLGIIVDAARLNRTRKQFGCIFESVPGEHDAALLKSLAIENGECVREVVHTTRPSELESFGIRIGVVR
jgi:hypothetical protein